jgi:hypothetical protein
MGWALPESGSAYFLRVDGRPAWCDRLDLLSKVAAANFNVILQSEATIFDLESLVGSMKAGVLPDPDSIVNAWNILDDLVRSFEDVGEQLPAVRITNNLALYDRIFSRTKAGAMIRAKPDEALKTDVKELLGVFKGGLEVLEKLTDSGNGGCH